MRVVAAGVMLLAAAAAQAQEVGWSIGVGAEQSDNIGRSSTQEESETILEVDFNANLDVQRARTRMGLAADMGYRDYLDDTFDSQVVGGLSGNLTYDIVPDRLVWQVEDNFTQLDVDAFAAENPDNRQNFNYLTTGPDLTLTFGARTNLILRGRFSDVYYEVSPFDSQRYLGAATLMRILSDTRNVSLNVSHQTVEFDEELVRPGYDVQQAFLGYQETLSRTTFDLNLGMSRLKDSLDTSDSLVARASIGRKVGARSQLTLNLGTEHSDAAGVLRRAQSSRGVIRGNEDAVASPDPFRSDFMALVFRVDGRRTNIATTLRWRQESREQDSALDRETLGASIRVSRRVSPRTTASARVSYEQEDFDTSNQELDDWSAGVGASFELRQNLHLRADYNHYEGSGQVSTRDYDENRFSVRLSYSSR